MKKSHFVRVTMSMVFEMCEPSDGIRLDVCKLFNDAMDGMLAGAKVEGNPWLNIQPGGTVEARVLDEQRYLKKAGKP